MERQFTIKKTPELMAKLAPFWKEAAEAADAYRMKLSEIETRMYEATKIEGILFWMGDDGLAGIGNLDKSMELIHDIDLYKELGWL